jgi:hypothetical protein
MIAAKNNMTISELLLSSVREMIPSPSVHEPNAETVKALKESRKGKLKSYQNLDEFWKAMEIDPNA